MERLGSIIMAAVCARLSLKVCTKSRILLSDGLDYMLRGSVCALLITASFVHHHPNTQRVCWTPQTGRKTGYRIPDQIELRGMVISVSHGSTEPLQDHRVHYLSTRLRIDEDSIDPHAP